MWHPSAPSSAGASSAPTSSFTSPICPKHRSGPNSPPCPGARTQRRWRPGSRGRTGVPLVDAGMRELWQTGYMHNRVRMVVASFLTKNLLIDWRAGARWFADCLVDHSPASNAASWQWVAGSGLDAAPYFRIFNPAIQAAKFDPEGTYIRRFVPELAPLPDRWIGAPWTAPETVLARAGLRLGRDYPRPIVDLAASRERALAAWHALRGNVAQT
ncbi:FAD-binding domain-containing protein [Jhaorihella thermophila]